MRSLIIAIVTPLGYQVQITRRLAHSAPWTGALVITVNKEGLISGRYHSTSAKPDPLYGKIVNVSGAVSGQNIRIDFNPRATYQARGTIESGKIIGTFTDPRRALYDFTATRAPVTL